MVWNEVGVLPGTDGEYLCKMALYHTCSRENGDLIEVFWDYEYAVYYYDIREGWIGVPCGSHLVAWCGFEGTEMQIPEDRHTIIHRNIKGGDYSAECL